MKDLPVSKKIGIGIVCIQLVSTIFFAISLIRLGMLPTIYCGAAIAVLVLLFIIMGIIQLRAKKKAVFSKIISVLISVILLFGGFYIFKTGNVMASISNTDNVKVDKFVVAVLADDSAETMNDVKDYLFGVQYALKEEEIKTVIETIEQELGITLKKAELDNIQKQLRALYSGEVQAIIINEAYIELMDDELEEVSKKIKIIHTYEMKQEVQTVPERVEIEVESDAFIVYVSGIDVYGNIDINSRSDVNILAVVNPTTHRILLVTTPRDYYVPFPGVTGGKRDKLTHAGIYGIDVSMDALGKLYDIDPDFYVRVNFTSLIKIVDALGGINVKSEISFTTYTDEGKMYVEKGLNHFNGKQTLAFCRERKSLAGGDNQRGKNQEAAFKAIIEKLLSPAILTGANGLISSVQGNVQTNMSQEQIQELIKAQLDNPQPWSIEMMAATGTGDMNYCYSMPGTKLYVSWPNEASVNSIKTAIQGIMK